MRKLCKERVGQGCQPVLPCAREPRFLGRWAPVSRSPQSVITRGRYRRQREVVGFRGSYLSEFTAKHVGEPELAVDQQGRGEEGELHAGQRKAMTSATHFF